MNGQKYPIGSRVSTTLGLGTVIGYDLEGSKAWRHQVKLDSGIMFEGHHPCFFNNEISLVSKENFEKEK